MGAKVSEVLRHKGHNVVTVAPRQTVASVAKVLTENRIGAAPVINEEGHLVGIISERDIIRGMAKYAEAAPALAAEELMSREVKTCSSEDKLVDLMQVMTLQRIRHLPVVESGALKGIVSIGDVVKQCLEEVQVEVEQLHTYIRSP
ncbi:MAG: CBS domain-containing protein [Candidatus Binataceae bacterium]